MSTFFTKIRNQFYVLRTFSVNPLNYKNSAPILPNKLPETGVLGKSSYKKIMGVNAKPITSSATKHIQDTISSLQIKKRPLRKKRIPEDEEMKPPGLHDVVAFSTAEEYNLEELMKALKSQDLYDPKPMDGNLDAVHAIAKYQLGTEPRDLFFFREGSVVMWNVTDLESSNVLAFLKPHEQDGYSERVVLNEAEYMTYKKAECAATLAANGDIVLSPDENSLEKYTFSNAMALSVKLGVWEASLEKYINTIEFVTEDLKRGRRIKMTQAEVLRKHGELFALRHVINLSSDLLDTPDFYWDRDQLETLYSKTCAYFSIARRTRVMNEKINHCVELIELLSSHLSDKHHVRLEWMIIVLIMVEVAFETIHYVSGH